MDKTAKIVNCINSIIPLTDDELSLFLSYINTKVLKKNDYLLKEGQVCDFIAFVNTGVLIYTKTLDNADEVTTDFAFDGEWVTDNYSRLKKYPSILNIKAIEETELLFIRQVDLCDLYSKIPDLNRFGRIMMEEAFVKITQHSIDLQVLPAKERYLKLLNNYPQVFRQIPLYHIANYLGIAPKSLSRIRNTIFSKD